MKKKNIPNAISIGRIVASPVVAAFMWSGNFSVGIPLYMITALTDLVDGKLARKWGVQSVEGKYLDMVADKIFAAIMLFTVIPIYPVLWTCLGMEVAIGSISYEASKRQHNTSSAMIGKIKTAVLSVLMGTTLLTQFLPVVESLIPLLFISTFAYQTATLRHYVKHYKNEEERLEEYPENILKPSEAEVTDLMTKSDLAIHFVNQKAIRTIYHHHLYRDYFENFASNEEEQKYSITTCEKEKTFVKKIKK